MTAAARNFIGRVSNRGDPRDGCPFLPRGEFPAEIVNKVQEGSPHIADKIKNGEIAMVINTPTDAYSQADSYYLRRCAWITRCLISLPSPALAAAEGIDFLRQNEFDVRALQDYGAAPQP